MTRFSHAGLKSADTQSTASQTIAATRQYDAFGNSTTSGTWTGPFGHGGSHGYQEDPTGLQLLGHRYYDPSTGRFLSRDPILDGRNFYSYGGGYGSPTGFADPTGLMSLNTPQGRKIQVELLIQQAQQSGTFHIGQAVLGVGGAIHRHHVYPQLFKHKFAHAGINIDKHLLRLPDWFHKYLHRGQDQSLVARLRGVGGRGGWWNNKWQEFFRRKPNATKKEIEAFLDDLLQEARIWDLKHAIGP